MKISYNWLKQFIKTDWSSEETATLLTDLGLEVEVVEKFQSIKGGLEGIVVGHVLTCEQHPNADRLKVTTVDLGDSNPVQIVCGASNVAAGQKVLVATIGSTLYTKEGDSFQIKKSKIRDVESHGMICAEDELGLGNSHDGIMVLEDSQIPGTKATNIFEIEIDEIFEIGLTPNRADAMSHFGVARDLKAGMIQKGTNISLVTPSVSSFHIDQRSLQIKVKVENTQLIPRYCGVTISGIQVKESPIWLQNRLKAIGLSTKNNIVDATNYVLHEIGQPLHAFDASKISGNIEVKTVAAGTKFITLDGIERSLHEDDIMICDEKKPLCIGGIYGGLDSGVTEKTTNIFLESAYFNPISIRKTAKRFALSTDASFRFERGIDINLTDYALKRAALLIQEIAGGEITSDLVDVFPKKIEDFQVFLNFEKAFKIIGQEIPKETIKNILASLEIKVSSVTDAGLGLQIPSYRVDVTREIDVIEEILRVYGYNNIKFSNKLNATVSNSSRTEDFKLQNIVADMLTSVGFNEMMANSLTSLNYDNISKNINSEDNVTILNPLSSDLSVMRQTMLFSALEAVSYNINRRNADLKLFEFGKTYHKTDDASIEIKHLSLVSTGKSNAESWTNPQQNVSFFSFKTNVDLILNRLGITKAKFQPTQNDIFSEGIALTIGTDILVELGTIKKSILKQFDIKQDVFYADFDWANVIKIVSNKIKITDIPKFPEVRRDLALLLDENVTYDSVYKTAILSDKNLIKNINLFDVYQGEKLPEGKKSYAVGFTIQDTKQTLTEDQIEKLMHKLQKNFEKELGATIR